MKESKVTAVVNILMQRNTTKTNIPIKSQRRSTLRKMIETSPKRLSEKPIFMPGVYPTGEFRRKREHLSSAYPSFQ